MYTTKNYKKREVDEFIKNGGLGEVYFPGPQSNLSIIKNEKVLLARLSITQLMTPLINYSN